LQVRRTTTHLLLAIGDLLDDEGGDEETGDDKVGPTERGVGMRRVHISVSGEEDVLEELRRNISLIRFNPDQHTHPRGSQEEVLSDGDEEDGEEAVLEPGELLAEDGPTVVFGRKVEEVAPDGVAVKAERP
jgi:hypothetical protein